VGPRINQLRDLFVIEVCPDAFTNFCVLTACEFAVA